MIMLMCIFILSKDCETGRLSSLCDFDSLPRKFFCGYEVNCACPNATASLKIYRKPNLQQVSKFDGFSSLRVLRTTRKTDSSVNVGIDVDVTLKRPASVCCVISVRPDTVPTELQEASSDHDFCTIFDHLMQVLLLRAL